MTKRQNNSPYKKYKLKDGKIKWSVNAYWGLDSKTGEEIRIRKQGFDTRAAAKVYHDREVERLNNSANKASKKDITFEEMFEKYLSFYKNTGVTESTQIKFESEIRNHILPYLGKYYLQAITISDCQKVVEKVRLKRKDFRKIIGHARAVFNYAIHESYLKENPMEQVILRSGKVSYKKRRISRNENFYTPEQLMTFLNYYEQHGNFHEFVYFRLLAFGGLRRGEALALYKSDLNLKDQSLKITKTLTESRDVNSAVSHYTKTGDASDTQEYIIYLDQITFDLLVKKTQQTKFKLANNTTRMIYGSKYIFTSPKTGKHYHRQIANDWLNNFWDKHRNELEKNGLHYISPHGFRHSQATLLYELDVNPKDAQHRLRHKNIKTTMDIYTHISENRNKKAVDKLNAFESSRTRNRTKIVNLSDYTSL